MTSYLRSMFGIGGQSVTAEKTRKSHKRPSSAPAPSLPPSSSYNIYAASTVTPSSAPSGVGRDRRDSHGARPPTPSPLRYATYNSGSIRSSYSESIHSASIMGNSSHSHQIQGLQQQQPKPTRAPMYRTLSNTPGDRHPAPYPIYSSSNNSIHTMSSSYCHGSSVSGHRPPLPPLPPRTASYGSVAASEPKPVLKPQSQSWSSHGMHTSGRHHVSFMLPRRRTALHMHPLLAYGRLHRPPISYDVVFAPSSRIVVDRNTHSPIPALTLSQPATEPPLPNRLILKCSKIPWTIVASPSGAKATSRFYIAGSEEQREREKPPCTVTNIDVLYAIHNTLSARVTRQEWEALGHGSRAQRKVTQAYEKRCLRMKGGWEDGVRRVDYLGEKTRLVGVEMEKTGEGEVGKLVFA